MGGRLLRPVLDVIKPSIVGLFVNKGIGKLEAIRWSVEERNYEREMIRSHRAQVGKHAKIQKAKIFQRIHKKATVIPFPILSVSVQMLLLRWKCRKRMSIYVFIII